MKFSKLLVLSALWLFGLGANAANLIERVAPEEPNPLIDDIESVDKTAADFVVGDCYVLYNKGAAKFYYQGNAWGTQATGAIDQAMIVRFVMPAGKTLDDKQLYLRNYVPSKSKWMTAFVTTGDGNVNGVYGDATPALFVDNNDGGAALMWVEGIGNKTYRISIAEDNTAAQPEGCFMGIDDNGPGVSGGDEGTCIMPKLAEGEGINLDWEFYAIPEWATYFKELEVYEKSEELKGMIEIAENANVDVSAAVAVYNDLSATVEQLQKAIDDLRVLMANALDGASEENPLDATFMLRNANFDSGTVEGWDITYKGGSTEATNIGYQGATYTNGDVQISGFIEAWKNTSTPDYLGDGSITQTIQALPAGKYMLGVDVIANNQGRKSVDGNPDGLPDDVELFATASADGKTYSTPMATRNGAPEHFQFTFIHTGGDMTMGLRVIGSAQATMPANWIAMDNLTLTYYGEVQEDPDKVLLNMAIDEALKAYPLDKLDEIVAYVGDKEAFKAAIEEAQAVTENYLDYIEKVNAAKKQLDASVAAYKTFAAKAEEWENNMGRFDFDTEEWGAYCDFASNMAAAEGYPEMMPEDVLREQSLTIAEIEAYITLVDDLYKAAIANSLVPGDDFTAMLDNPDFEYGLTSGNAEGWTVIRGTGTNLTPGPLGSDLDQLMIDAIGKTNHCFEGWHRYNWDVYQEIKTAPAGVYEITCQGYVRCEMSNYHQGDELTDVPIKLYMNSFTSNLPDVYSEQVPADKFDENGALPVIESWSWTGDNYPNSMGGASLCFAWGMYNIHTFGLVQEGEPMRIGVKNTSNTDWWCIWDNFHVTYRGFEAEYVQPALEAALVNIDTSKPMAKSIKEQAVALEAEAAAAIAAGDGKAMYDVLVKVNALVESASASVALFAKLQAANEDLMAVALESTSAAKNEALALFDEIQAHIEASDIENEDAEAYLVKISAMKTKLRIPDTSTASDEAPVDVTSVIETPGFEKDGTNSLDGWTATGQKFGNDDQLSALALESWESVFHIYQDIYGLPEGIYTLKVNGWQRTANPTYLYAESGDQTFSKELITQEAGLPEGATAPNSLIDARNMFDDVTYMNELVLKVAGDKLRIGVRKDQTSSSDWIVIDEFQLWYYGANSALTPDGDATGIENVAAPMTVKVEYYTLDGRKANGLQKGIMIQKLTFENGSVVVRKVRK